MASTVVIASSTMSVRAMISAPSETRCRSIANIDIREKTMARVSGIVHATTAPGRAPRLRKLTMMMMMIACHSDVVNSLIAVSTVTAWSATRTGSMPTGRLATTSFIVALMLRPSARMSPASRIAIAIPMAGCPFTRNIGCGGSA